MRSTIWLVIIALLGGMTFAPVRAEDLSRIVWVAQAPELVRSGETIPVPNQVPRDCPTLEQLGYQTKRLSELSLDVALADKQLPADCSLAVFESTAVGHDGRSWMATEFNWSASDLFAQPAYFDDPVLERYGQTRHPCLQPWLSGAHFFGQFPLMPYSLIVNRPFDKVYTLGYSRPGTPTPCVMRRLPRP